MTATITIGFDQPLYILPFDQRESFQTKMFGWKGDLSLAQRDEIAAAKAVIYEGFQAAVAGGVPKEFAAIFADGIELSRDLLPLARSAVYAIAYRRRNA